MPGGWGGRPGLEWGEGRRRRREAASGQGRHI